MTEIPDKTVVTISIIINNYNYARFLPQCIESVLNQTYSHKEIIAVDDGSTDDSREVIQQYGKHLKTVFKKNGGQASALNAGFQQSIGDLVIFLDSDDFLYPGALEQIADAWRPGLSKIHWRLRKIDAAGTEIGIIPKLKWRLSAGPVAQLQVKYGLVSPPTSGNAFTRESLMKIMPVPEGLFRICADSYLFARVPFFGNFVAVDKILGGYKIHGVNNYAGGGKYDRQKLNLSVRQSLCVNDMIIADARRCGIKVEEDIIFRNPGALKNRMISFLSDRDGHPIPGDSLVRILKSGWKWVFRSKFVFWPQKMVEFIQLVVLSLGLLLKPNK